MLELFFVFVSFLLMFGYHARLRWLVRTYPLRTAFGRHEIARKRWLRTYAGGGGGRDMIVIHTMRNWIMSATFLASTSILLTLGLLGVAFTTDRRTTFVHELNLFGSQTEQILLLKLLILALVFLTAFFCFSLAVRSFTHGSFEINLPLESKIYGRHTDELEKGALYYFLGLRSYYMSIPLAIWLFGPVWLLAATLVMVMVLMKLD